MNDEEMKSDLACRKEYFERTGVELPMHMTIGRHYVRTESMMAGILTVFFSLVRNESSAE